MAKLDEQISTLEERLKALKLRQQRTEARKKTIDAKRERKADTRRKILIGGVILARVKNGLLQQDDLQRWLDASLARSDDRALFELPVSKEAR